MCCSVDDGVLCVFPMIIRELLTAYTTVIVIIAIIICKHNICIVNCSVYYLAHKPEAGG